MNVLDLFSGIGGFSLGLERAGMRTVAFCEVEPYCRAVLAKHWPGVPVHGDIRTLDAATVAAYAADLRRNGLATLAGSAGEGETEGRMLEPSGTGVDLICGGFPCQPFSHAGKRRGAEDDRHLWPEMARVIAEVRPAWVVGENVAGLVKLGLDSVLSDLESMGYTIWPVVLPACAVDAPHRRDRLWIVAHDDRQQRGTNERKTDAKANRRNNACGSGQTDQQFAQWQPEPGLGRVAHGVSNRVDRLRALGNAVVPQVVEVIGRAIMQAEAAQSNSAAPKVKP